MSGLREDRMNRLGNLVNKRRYAHSAELTTESLAAACGLQFMQTLNVLRDLESIGEIVCVSHRIDGRLHVIWLPASSGRLH